MIRFSEFEDLGVAAAAMSDVSDGDCGLGDSQEGAENRSRFITACGIAPENAIAVRQIHGAKVLPVDSSMQGRGSRYRNDALGDLDGMVTATGGLGIIVQVADCVPVFLFDPVRHVGGLVHAGRKGTLHGIAVEGVRVLASQFDAVPGGLHALVGPSAGPCCYEVSEAMAQDWASEGLPHEGRRLNRQ